MKVLSKMKSENNPAPQTHSNSVSSDRVFSGIQPTGTVQLGNYLGALVNWVAMQESHETFYCIVDLHAITVAQDPKELRDNTLKLTATLIACGIDPQRATLFHQSSVREHSELAWILNCVARLGWLNRMTQFKDKAGKDKERASVGLYTYPVLQAADILAYKATHVPVGEDQKQHLELSRDIAAKFNHDFDVAGFFPEPEPYILGPGARVMSLRDGTKKMSKSDPSDLSRINLNDDAETMAKKIRKAKTDPEALPSDVDGLEGRPEAQNLVGIYAALAGTTVKDVLRDYEGKGFGDFKPALADLVVETLSPISQEIGRLSADEKYLKSVLDQGTLRARSVAEPIVKQVKEIVGFL